MYKKNVPLFFGLIKFVDMSVEFRNFFVGDCALQIQNSCKRTTT